MTTTKTKTVRAAAYAPDGTELTYTSPPNKWDVAGIARRDNSRWAELAHGNSYDSVRRRALTQAYRWPGYDPNTVQAVRIWEATAPLVREYFGHHKVNIKDIFQNGVWRSAKLHGGWSNIRKLSLQGVTAIAFEGIRATAMVGTRVVAATGPVVADFQVEDLLKSMRLPKQKMCRTRGHNHIPATHRVTWAYTGAPEKTEHMCQACLDIMLDGEDKGIVASLSAIPLAR